MRIVLVTGMSGSGKSVAIRLLEDAGYYCIDNLPSRFLGEVCAYLEGTGHGDVALSVDSRSEAALGDVPDIVATLRANGHDVRVLFLTASNAALVQRYSETRRRHPMALREQPGGSEATLTESIQLERELLSPLINISHVIDTSELHPNTLRQWVRQFTDLPPAALVLAFESFAFKQGVPFAADFVFDVRNLPNPHYDPLLRPLTGLDAPVAAYLQRAPQAGQMLDDISHFLDKWLPSYVADNRHYVTVAIGCTGGRHRSVYMVEELARRFGMHRSVLVRHRGLEQG
ncbi:MAG TPA: RNase adapter RapZ [Burkholderiaceae bacterium]|nr:RNase adapter RapZ [Burkholderiaceae bacterium]